MKFNYYMDVFNSLFKITIIKVKYRTSSKIAWKQRFGKRFELKLCNSASVEIDEKLYSQSDAHILVDGGKLSIGKNVFLNHNVSITCMGKISIEDNVTIANNVVIVDHNHDYLGGIGKFVIGNVKVGNNVWIGANAVILPGVSLEENCVVGAGSVVTHSFPRNSVIIGIPARAILK